MRRSGLRFPPARALLAALAGLLACAPAAAEEASTGQFITQRTMLDTLVSQCAARFPESRERMESKLAAWKSAHAPQLAAADRTLADMPAEQRETVETALKPMGEMISANLDVAAREGKGPETCDEGFASLGAELKTGHFDADNFDEAIGMYEMTMLIEGKLAPRCLQAAPDARAEFEGAAARWHEQDAAIQQVVRKRIREVEANDAEAYAQMQVAAQTQIDAVVAMLDKAGPEAFVGYCRQQYAELTDGTKRRESPEMYRYLEEAAAAANK